MVLNCIACRAKSCAAYPLPLSQRQKVCPFYQRLLHPEYYRRMDLRSVSTPQYAKAARMLAAAPVPFLLN